MGGEKLLPQSRMQHEVNYLHENLMQMILKQS